jgi:Apea-like HEPN
MPQPPAPAPLLSLAREAVAAIAATDDVTTYRGMAMRNLGRDAVIQALPSYEAAKNAVCAPPLVATRYGSKEQAGDRLTLQFVYQLFPRDSELGVGQDAHRLWGRFRSELNAPDWVYRGVANLRNFNLAGGVPNPLQLEDGVTIRGRDFDLLGKQGFNEFTLEALAEDWSVGAASEYVICIERRVPKSPDNLIRIDATLITTAWRAITCMRLSARGDVRMGSMWFTRDAKFNVGMGGGANRSGWSMPTSGGSQFVLTRAVARKARSLQGTLKYLEQNGYGRGPGNLELSLRSFESSYDRFPARPDSKLLDIITAAEAVVGTDVEITFKISFRIAGLLGRTNAERVEVFGDMKRFYDVRSKIVHGATLRGWRVEMLDRADDAREFMRRLLVAFLRLAASTTATRYTKAFFADELDAELQDEQARRRMLRELGITGR